MNKFWETWSYNARQILLELFFPEGQNCPVCGRRREKEERLCPDCAARMESLRILHSGGEVKAAYFYDSPVSDLIKRLKFEGQRWLAPHLAVDLAQLYTPDPEEWVTAVPLHPKRRRERGFNQSELLARAAFPGKVKTLLVRTRYTQSQSRLSGPERRENVKDAFALAPGVCVQGRRVLLLDDICTTQSTLNACRKVLEEAGATVTLLAWAKTKE